MRTEMIFIALAFSSPLAAQKIFSEQHLLEAVKKIHPVARQAFLDVRIAKANLTASRSGFDPVATAGSGRKEFEGITYYGQQWSELKIPTWYGIDFYAGVESLNGSRINPEETKGSVNYVGVSVPIIQNLTIDKRRAAVLQAKNFLGQSEITRKIIINDLLQEALVSYWQWWEQYHVLNLVRSSLQNAKKRFEMVRTAYRLGDRPAIDTVEALTQVQIFEQKENETIGELIKSRLQLSTFLWTENNTAYELPEDASPEWRPEEKDALLDSFLQAAKVHPAMLEYDYKLYGLQIERRLKFQSLLPQVGLKYNQVGRDVNKTLNSTWFNNNYRFGISMSVPLRLSEGRGAYHSARLKIEQTELERANKQVQLQNKVSAYYAERQQTAIQQNRQKSLVANYTALQKGEETRFLNGESSLFLINTREIKTIEAQQKLIELNSKYQQASVRLKGAAALFGQD